MGEFWPWSCVQSSLRTVTGSVQYRVRTVFLAKNSSTFRDLTLKFLLYWELCFEHQYELMQKYPRMRAWKHVQTRHSLCICGSIDIRESKERALGTQKYVFAHFLSISRSVYHLFSLAFIYFKLVSIYIFQSHLGKEIKYFKDQKSISSTFKALAIGVLNSKDFPDADEPRGDLCVITC